MNCGATSRRAFALSGKGAPRGWTRPLSPAVTIEQPPRQIVMKWLGEDESSPREVPGGSPALIDARPVEGGDRSPEQTPRPSSSEDVGVVQAFPHGPERLNQRQDVPERAAPTPTLPVWPGPYPPPPLVAHLYAQYASPQPGLGKSAALQGRAVRR
jgi:hypothetical protein